MTTYQLQMRVDENSSWENVTSKTDDKEIVISLGYAFVRFVQKMVGQIPLDSAHLEFAKVSRIIDSEGKIIPFSVQPEEDQSFLTYIDKKKLH